MQQLIYVSKWTDETYLDVDDTLQRIVTTSIQNNRLDNVTGFLLAQDGIYLQLLEGPQAGVRATYQRISRDGRHSDIKILSDTVVGERLFRQWNMAAVQGIGDLGVHLTNADAARTALVLSASNAAMAEQRLATGRLVHPSV